MLDPRSTDAGAKLCSVHQIKNSPCWPDQNSARSGGAGGVQKRKRGWQQAIYALVQQEKHE